MVANEDVRGIIRPQEEMVHALQSLSSQQREQAGRELHADKGSSVFTVTQ